MSYPGAHYRTQGRLDFLVSSSRSCLVKWFTFIPTMRFELILWWCKVCVQIYFFRIIFFFYFSPMFHLPSTLDRVLSMMWGPRHSFLKSPDPQWVCFLALQGFPLTFTVRHSKFPGPDITSSVPQQQPSSPWWSVTQLTQHLLSLPVDEGSGGSSNFQFIRTIIVSSSENETL